MLDKKSNIFKFLMLPGKHGRIYGRYKHEGRSALPGDICRSATGYRH